MVVRILKEHTNNDPNTNSVLPNHVDDKEYTILDKLEDEAYTEDITLTNGQVVTYSGQSDSLDLLKMGGYNVFWPRNKTQASTLDYFNDNNLFPPNWVNIMMVYSYVNRNKDDVTFNLLHLKRKPSGEIEGVYVSMTTREYYSTHLDRFRAFLEVIFITLTSFFLYELLKTLYIMYCDRIKPRYDKQTPAVKRSKICRICNIDRSILRNKACISFIFLL